MIGYLGLNGSERHQEALRRAQQELDTLRPESLKREIRDCEESRYESALKRAAEAAR